MKPFDLLLSRCAFATGFVLCLFGVFAHATEVASPSNLFPSPTGIFKTSSPPITYNGVAVQCQCSHLRMASASVSPPTAGLPAQVTFQCLLDVGVSSDGGTTFSWATFPASVSMSISPGAAGAPGSYDTEMLSMSVNGLLGGMMLRESPTLASMGHHTIRQAPSGTFFVSSFFDVFTELSVDGGASWMPGNAPTHLDLDESPELMAATGDVPPAGAVTSCVTDIAFPSKVVVRDLALKTSGPILTLPMQGQLFQGNETGKASGQLSLDGGATFAPFECDYSGKRKFSAPIDVQAGEICDGELISFTLGGGSLPSNVRIRESPTKQSLGRTSIRTAHDGLYRIGSFFDVFTEVSLTSGATWLPADGPPSVFGFNPVEVTAASVAMPSAHLLPPMGIYHSGNAADVFEFTDGTMTRGLHILLPSSSLTPPAQGAQPQVQRVACTVQLDVSSNGGVSYESQRMPATATVRNSPGSGGGGGGGSTFVFDTELLQLDAGGPGSPVMLRESPSKQSLGKTSITAASDGTKLISSFFDIFTEVSLDGGGTWSSSTRKDWCFMVRVSDEVIQPSPLYLNKMDLLDCDDAPDMVFPNGAVLRRVRIHPNQNGSDLPTTGNTNVITLAGTASGELSLDYGFTFKSWTGSCTGTCQVTSYLDTTSTRYFDTEMLALSLSGGSLGTVMVRESPTKQSLGRTSLRTTPSTSFGTCSFFDVFTELSLDSGATWTPANGAPTTFGLHQRHENFFSASALPLPGDYVSDAPLLLPNNVILYRLRKRPELLYQAWDDAISDRTVAFDGTIEGEISTDGGATREPFRTTCTSSVRVSSSSGGDRPMESLSLNFTITKGTQTYMIRESPTLQSTGKTSLRESPTLQSKGQTTVRAVGGGYMIDSFFDIFTELSVDGGIVWSPGSNLLHTYLLPYVEQDNLFRSNLFPPRDGSFDAHALSEPVTFPGTSSGIINNMRVRLDQLESRSQPLPSSSSPQTQSTTCVFECDLSRDGGATWTTVSAPADLSLQAQVRNGTTGTFDTEMLALNVSGGSLPAGVMIRESPTRASTGSTSMTSRLMEEEGIYYYFDSFFDVFTELSLDGGATWLPADGSCRLELHHVTPGTFNPSSWQPVVALHRAADPAFELHFEDTDVSISGVTFDRALTSDILPGGTTPPPAPGEQLKRACLFNIGLKGRSASGGGASDGSTNQWPCRGYLVWEFTDVLISSLQTSMTTEVTDLSVSGGALPSGFILRESPTRQSLGKTSLRTVPGGHRINSFFDVFLELSTDGGQTWHAATAPLHMECIDASPDHPVNSLSLAPPQNLIARASELSSRSASGKRVDSVQFASLIDSSLNLIDDRHLLGLRTYDVTLQYAAGDSAVFNNYLAQVSMTIDAVRTSDALDTSRLDSRIEITSFDVKGGTLPAAVRIRESPTLPSKGRCVIVAQADGTYRRSSFFDVFTEISVDGGGTWEPMDQPLRCELADRDVTILTTSDAFPPSALFLPSGMPVRATIATCKNIALYISSVARPVPTVVGGKLVYPLQGSADCVIALPGASDVPGTCPMQAMVSLTLSNISGGSRYFDTEMLSLSLGGGTLPGGVMIRESPSKASLGKTAIFDVGGGQFRIGSFFDIFIEMSLDGGQTWSESDGTMRLELPAPDIVVQSPVGTDLIDDVSSIDFGDVGINSGVATRLFTVKNNGGVPTGPLSTTITGANGEMFKIGVPPLSPVAPNGSTTFTVQVTPTSSGGKSATLHIISNDLSTPVFDIALTANGIPASLPAATTLGAGTITFSGSTVNGTANANAFARAVSFDYGPTTSYGSSITATPPMVTGTTLTNVSATLTGLQPHTLYHYRVRVVSAQGSANGADKTFTTLDRAPVAVDDGPVPVLPSAKVVIHVLANDTDADNDALSIFSFVAPSAAVGTVAKSGTDLIFTPSATFGVGGSFTYLASDTFGGKSALPAKVTLVKGTCTLGMDATIPSDSPPYDVSVNANAPWTIVGAPSWLSFTPPLPGDTKAHLIPAPNPSTSQRVADLKIGGVPYKLTQSGVGAAPVLTVPPTIPNAAISASYDLAIPTQNGPVTYTATGLPPGLTLSNTTGHVTGYPTTANTYHLSIFAKNAISTSNTINFDITVLDFPKTLVGSYSAAVEDSALSDQLGGLMTMSITGTGNVTGTLKLGIGRHPFTGRLNTAVDPAAPDPDHARLTTTVKRTGKPSVVLTVNMNSTATDLISGNVTLPVAPPGTATLAGSRHVWNATSNPATAGYFTTALQPATPLTAGIPQGDGFLTITITAAGAVTWSGQLADGSVIPATNAALWSNGDLPLFVLLYTSKGSLNQTLSIAPTTKIVSGNPHWLKPTQLGTVRAYAAGFATTLQAAGAEYVPPGAGKTLLNITAPATANIAFTDGGIGSVEQFSDLDEVFNVSATHVATFSTSTTTNPASVKLTKLDVAKGLFTGTMTLKDHYPSSTSPFVSRPVTFNGVLLPLASPATGTGYFLLPALTGTTGNVTTSPETSGLVRITP